MFPPFPGFENLPIHVEVEFGGRTRPVVARVETLPTFPSRAVPVCSFLDAPDQGEWLLGNSARDIYTFGNPDHLLTRRTIFRGVGVERESRVELDSKIVQSFIQRALIGEGNQLQVLRVVVLDLPHPPHIAFLSVSRGRWCNSWTPTREEVSAFATPNFDFFEQGANAKE